jgi:hypothetical protein
MNEYVLEEATLDSKAAAGIINGGHRSPVAWSVYAVFSWFEIERKGEEGIERGRHSQNDPTNKTPRMIII